MIRRWMIVMLAALMTGAGTAGAATASATAPAAGRPDGTLASTRPSLPPGGPVGNPNHLPAAYGPGLGKAPDQISAASLSLCAQVAFKAGFSYTSRVGQYRDIVIAVAVALAESSCNPSAEYTNPNGCRDRGMWQIDNCAWPNVTDSCAYNAQCNANQAYVISGDGSNWTPWSTYNSGVYLNYISEAVSAVSGFTIMLHDQGAANAGMPMCLTWTQARVT